MTAVAPVRGHEVAAPAETASHLVTLCRIDEIPLRGSRVVRTSRGSIAVFRTAESEVFALSDRCPHAGGPLSQGIVHGKSVTCPLHNWVINLETGDALGADRGQVATIPLRIAQGIVSVDSDDLARYGACRRKNATHRPPSR